ncbi:fucose 4-O-acetylase-like acetyltransferase [Bradyrhizobium sp. F1.13.4]
MFDTLRPVTGTNVPSSRTAAAYDRDLSLDFAKGALIVLVIVGHLIQYVIYRDDGFWFSPYYKSIYMFHMPLFMAISGYLSARSLLQKPFTRAATDRAKQLLLPMLFWWAMMETAKLAALWRATSLTSGLWQFADDLAATYWFIWATFISYLLINISTRLTRRSWVISGSAILVALAPLTFSISPLIRFTYPFFCFGFLLARSRGQWTSALRRHKPLLILFLSIVTCVCFLAWGKSTYVYNNLAVIHDFQSTKDVLLMFVGSAAASAIAIELLLQCWRLGHSTRMGPLYRCGIGPDHAAALPGPGYRVPSHGFHTIRRTLGSHDAVDHRGCARRRDHCDRPNDPLHRSRRSISVSARPWNATTLSSPAGQTRNELAVSI